MICIKLPTITVITKNDGIFEYAIDQNTVTLEDLDKYLKETYKDNIKEVRLANTIGYLRKLSYEK